MGHLQRFRRFQFLRCTPSQMVIYLACGLAFLSLFLPWVSVPGYSGFGFESREGKVGYFFFAYPLIAVACNARLIRWIGVLCGLVPGAWMTWIAVRFWEVNQVGTFVFLLACVMLAGASGAYRKAAD